WTGVPDGTWRIDASARGRLPARRTVVVQNGAAVAVEIELPRGATVRGTITMPRGSAPEDVWVGLASVERPDVRAGAAVRPDAAGSFAISGVAPGRWRAT